MDLPAEIYVYNGEIEFKQRAATLVAVHDHGMYEIKVQFPTKSGGTRTHRIYLPVHTTAILFRDPEPEYAEMDEIVER